MLVELPRNFLFFDRLPSRFMIDVVGEKNRIQKGTWYEVRINNQKTHILSQVNLNAGERVLVERQSSQKFKVIKRNLQNQIAENPDTSQQKAEKEQRRPIETARVSLTDLPQPQLASEFFSQLAVQFMHDQQGEPSWQTDGKTWHFDLPGTIPLAGAFTFNHEGYTLYLSQEPFEGAGIKNLQQEVEALVKSVGVERVVLVNSQYLKQLKSGIDMFG